MSTGNDMWAGDLRNYDGAEWASIIVALVTTFDELSLDDIHAYSDRYPMPLLARAT